jgi:phosphoribosylformylglycinamidine synthase PurS subunit
MKARVFVTLKKHVLDPQGKAVCSSLRSLGFGRVEDVRVGKMIEVALQGDSREETGKQVEEMCRKLLANPVIEDFRFELLD